MFFSVCEKKARGHKQHSCLRKALNFFLLSYVLSLLYGKREQIIKVPLETDGEDRIRLTSTMKLINVCVIAYYPRSSPLSNIVVSQNTPTDNEHITATSETQTIIGCRSNRHHYSATEHHGNPTAAAQTPTAVCYGSNRFLFLWIIYYTS